MVLQSGSHFTQWSWKLYPRKNPTKESLEPLSLSLERRCTQGGISELEGIGDGEYTAHSSENTLRLQQQSMSAVICPNSQTILHILHQQWTLMSTGVRGMRIHQCGLLRYKMYPTPPMEVVTVERDCTSWQMEHEKSLSTLLSMLLVIERALANKVTCLKAIQTNINK